MTFKSIDNDNEMSDLQRIKALEVVVAKTRKDLARVDSMLRLTPTKPRLMKQKGAIEKVIFFGASRDRQAASAGKAAKSTNSLGNETNHMSRSPWRRRYNAEQTTNDVRSGAPVARRCQPARRVSPMIQQKA